MRRRQPVANLRRLIIDSAQLADKEAIACRVTDRPGDSNRQICLTECVLSAHLMVPYASVDSGGDYTGRRPHGPDGSIDYGVRPH